MKFAWEGTSREGQFRTGVLEAGSLAEAEQRLRAQQITPQKVKRTFGQIEINMPRMSGVSTKTLVVFVRQLSTMIDAGLPLVQCLDILASQEPDKVFQKIVFGIKAQVETGSTLADALKKYPKVFDTLFVSLVQAGEVGGILDTILQRLAVYIEKSMKVKQKVAGAMKYPSFVMIALIGMLAIMLGKVIPGFAGMFQGMGKSLPALTQLVVDMSNGFIKNFPYIALIFTGLVIGFVMVLRQPWGARGFDWMLLRLPVLGPILRKTAIARFTRTLGTLVSSGVPILDGLDVVARSAGNKIIEESILYVRAKVAEGKNIAGPLEETNIFPKMVIQMIGVGEQTGAMDIMLTKIADFYEEEVDVAVDSLTSLIEPVIMVVFGGTIGFIMIAMYLPIFSMADAMSGKQ